MASHQRYKKMISNDDIGGSTAQIANWITSPRFNVSKIKFLFPSPTSSYFSLSINTTQCQIQTPASQPRLVLSLSPHSQHLTRH